MRSVRNASTRISKLMYTPGQNTAASTGQSNQEDVAAGVVCMSAAAALLTSMGSNADRSPIATTTKLVMTASVRSPSCQRCIQWRQYGQLTAAPSPGTQAKATRAALKLLSKV